MATLSARPAWYTPAAPTVRLGPSRPAAPGAGDPFAVVAHVEGEHDEVFATVAGVPAAAYPAGVAASKTDGAPGPTRYVVRAVVPAGVPEGGAFSVALAARGPGGVGEASVDVTTATDGFGGA